MDLSGLDLAGANLSHVNLMRSNLQAAQLNDSNLTGADLTGANMNEATLRSTMARDAQLFKVTLRKADLRLATLKNADIRRANLYRANLEKANLQEADLTDSDMSNVVLRDADARSACLAGCRLTEADMRGACLTGANFSRAHLVEANFQDADISGSIVYGASVWNMRLDGTRQRDLIITPPEEQAITVDNVELAHFIYLLLSNEKIRDVIDHVTGRLVLILGRFNARRKRTLDGIRESLRQNGHYVPVLFDFERPASRDLTETITTLAHLARFVIADLTEPRSIPQELSNIIPHLPSVPVVPIIHAGATEYGMFEHFARYPWVLRTYRYKDDAELLEALGSSVIGPAEDAVKKFRECAMISQGDDVDGKQSGGC
jgi:uncharacterized protein YjbI with pentapeptide repeats